VSIDFDFANAWCLFLHFRVLQYGLEAIATGLAVFLVFRVVFDVHIHTRDTGLVDTCFFDDIPLGRNVLVVDVVSQSVLRWMGCGTVCIHS
jgi:hypothetical protein